MTNGVLVPISIGELFDRMTILELKLQNITDKTKLANVEREYRELEAHTDEDLFTEEAIAALYMELLDVNSGLWDVEDKLRRFEATGKFDDDFIMHARSVYIMNDKRALIKRQINELFDQDIMEEKEYVDYGQN